MSIEPKPQQGPDHRPNHRPGQADRRRQPVIWIQQLAAPLTDRPINNTPGASARAVLTEIRRCAELLVADGVAGSVDLRVLRTMPGEREILAGLLGRGEVSAVVESIGRSEVQETAIPCIWWLRHCDDDGAVIGETIEITDIPELLVGDRDATVIAFESLQARLRAGNC